MRAGSKIHKQGIAIPVSFSFLNRLLLSEEVNAFEEWVKELLIASKTLHADETGLRVLIGFI
jgi:hypothetical protein